MKNERKFPVICLTGKMASGKNQVASILEEKGCVSIDADKVVHKAIELAKDEIVKTFSEDAEKAGIVFLNEDGTVNRKKLGQIVFLSKENIRKQENIVYPFVNRILSDFIYENPSRIVIINATVLYKSPVMESCDFVIYVDANTVKRFFRARKRDGLSFMQIVRRFFSQKDLYSQYQKKCVDIYKVTNSGSMKALEQKVMKIFQGFQICFPNEN